MSNRHEKDSFSPNDAKNRESIKDKNKFKGLKGTCKNFLRKKIRRNLEDNHTNDSTIQNKSLSESDTQSNKMNQNNKIICFRSNQGIKYSQLRKIFKNYGKIKNIYMKE